MHAFRILLVGVALLVLSGCSASEEDLKATVPKIPEQTGLDKASPQVLAQRKAIRCAPDKVSLSFLEDEGAEFLHTEQFRTFFDCANYNFEFQPLEKFFHSGASPQFLEALMDSVNGIASSENSENIKVLLDPWFQEQEGTGKAKIDHILPIVSDVIKNVVFRKGLPLLATMLDHGKPIWNSALEGFSLLIYNHRYPDLWEDMRKLFNILETGEDHNLLALHTREFFVFLKKENPDDSGRNITNAQLLLELADDLNNFETPDYGFIHLFEYANNRDVFSALYQTASEAMRGEKVMAELNQSEADMQAKVDRLFEGGANSPLMQLMEVVKDFNEPRPKFLPSILEWFTAPKNKERMHRGMFEFVGRRLIGELLGDIPVAKFLDKNFSKVYGRRFEYQVPKEPGSTEMVTKKCRRGTKCSVPPQFFLDYLKEALLSDAFAEHMEVELEKRAISKFGSLNSELLFKYGKISDFEKFAEEVTAAVKLADTDATMREIFTDEAIQTLRGKYVDEPQPAVREVDGGSPADANAESSPGPVAEEAGTRRTLSTQVEMIREVVMLYVAAKYSDAERKHGELVQRVLALYRDPQLLDYARTLFEDANGAFIDEVKIDTAINTFAKMHLKEKGEVLDGRTGPEIEIAGQRDSAYEHLVGMILDVSQKAWGTSIIIDEAFRVAEIFLSDLADKFKQNEADFTFSQWVFRSTYSNPDFMEKLVYEGKRSKILDPAKLPENILWLKNEIGPEIFAEGSRDLEGFQKLMDQIPNFMLYVESGMARGGNNLNRVMSDRDSGYLIKKWVDILCEAYDRGWTLKFMPVWKDFMDYMDVKQKRTIAKNEEVRAAMGAKEARIEDFRQARRQYDGVSAMRHIGKALFRPRNNDDNFDESLMGEMLVPIAPLAREEKRAETLDWLLELSDRAIEASDEEIDAVYEFFSGDKLPENATEEQIEEQRKTRKMVADLVREPNFPQVLVELDQLFKDEAVVPALDFIRDKIDDGDVNHVLELTRKVLGIRKFRGN